MQVKGGEDMTPREGRNNVVKLTLHVNGEVVEAAKIEAIKQKIPVSLFIENLIREKLNLTKVLA